MKTHTKIVLASGLVLTIGAVTLVGFANAKGGDRHGGGWHGDHGSRGGGRMAMIVEKIDADGDGTLTQAELDAFRTSRMTEFDADGDGMLSLDEFQSLWVDMTRPHMVDGFQKLDEDGDAAITADELQAPMTKMMSWLDKNEDGELSKDELNRKHGRRHGHDDDRGDD